MTVARYMGLGVADREHMPLRCGCRSVLMLEQVDCLVIATCTECEATWEMQVVKVTFGEEKTS